MTRGLVARLAAHDRLVEVGIGRRPEVAAALTARGSEVTATDIHERPVPDGVRFVRDDVTDPDPSVYRNADAVYALRCPPELQRPAAAAASRADADFLFTTLGGDPAVVPAARTTVEAGTLFEATTEPGARRPHRQPRRGGGSP
ncbi:UPF0146 family protein [Haloglomus litoreum]|uniref:UPF0146 family protein n=1 Tax=Haloglomus litoreum TaxID=3034026 RepID=UPI0023E81D55|nr:UPF0146 family protein [Haloglomus sp. DT116]